MINLHDVSAQLKSVAQEELLPRFAQVEAGIKQDGSVVTEADLMAQQRVASWLQEGYPAIGFLGEEMSATEQSEILASGRPVWCLDPLDGTTNFVSGVPYFCISLSLIQENAIQLGIVYDPLRDELFMARRGAGATLNYKPLVTAACGLSLKQATALVDFKRLPTELAVKLVSENPYASQRSFGSVALDWCWLAAGRVHLYLHGASSVWDYAAGNLICSEAGGYSTTLDGEEVFANHLEKRSCVGAIDADLFRDWKQFLGIG